MSPISNSIREVDARHWLIQNTLLLAHDKVPRQPNHASWSDGKGGFFVLSDAPKPQPPSKPTAQGSQIQKVHEGGTSSAVWEAGEAFVKVKQIECPEVTREHTTLEYLHRRQLDFAIPTVYFHTEIDGRYYVVLSKLHGRTLADSWLTMAEPTKQVFVDRIATICESLATWTGETISGVDGHQLSEFYLAEPSSNESRDFRSHALVENCRGLGMDCSSFVFYHCDLGPGNIIVTSQNSVGIIDWEIAGFVPREWIRTKFRLSGGLDLPLEDLDRTERTEWRRRVSQRLEKMGFQDVVSSWTSWRNSYT